MTHTGYTIEVIVAYLNVFAASFPENYSTSRGPRHDRRPGHKRCMVWVKGFRRAAYFMFTVSLNGDLRVTSGTPGGAWSATGVLAATSGGTAPPSPTTVPRVVNTVGIAPRPQRLGTSWS